MNLLSILLNVNWTEINSNWINYAISGYETLFGGWVYPLLFMGVIGYVYAINKSAIAAAVAICIIFGIFGTTAIFIAPEIQHFRDFGAAIVIVSLAGLFTALFASKNWGK